MFDFLHVYPNKLSCVYSLPCSSVPSYSTQAFSASIFWSHCLCDAKCDEEAFRIYKNDFGHSSFYSTSYNKAHLNKI